MFTWTKSLVITSALAFLLMFSGAFLYVQRAQDGSSAEQAASIERVDNKYVCMVNDQHYEAVQIEVPLEEKTYYGCCQGCVKTLTQDPESRTAQDPITGATVDKATAVVGALPDGSVRYFESTQTLRKFRNGAG